MAEIEGLAEVVARLKALPAEIAGKNGGPLRKALAAAARVIRDDARARAPYAVDGVGAHMRDQIVMKRDPNPRATDNAAERYIVTVKYKAKRYANNRRNRRAGLVGHSFQNFGDFHYWRFVEFGTSKMAPRPFMRAAFEAQKDALPAIVRDQLQVAIAKIVRSMK